MLFRSINGNDYPTPDGTCVRDFVHVADLADAHVQALRYVLDGGARPAFNLGCGQAVSIQELIHTVRAVTGRDMAVVVKQRRAGDPACLVADIGAAVEGAGVEEGETPAPALVDAPASEAFVSVLSSGKYFLVRMLNPSCWINSNCRFMGENGSINAKHPMIM